MNQEKEPQKNVPVQPENTEPADTASEEEAENSVNTQEDAAEKNADEKDEKTSSEEEEETEKKKKKKDGPSFFQSEKFKHGSTATAFTAGFIVVVILVNVIVGILSDKFPSINLDVTKSGGNTLSADAVKIVDEVKIPVSVTVCATKQACESNAVSASQTTMTDYSQVSRLVSKIAERNSKISVNYVDLDKDPTFATKYKGENIAAGDVVVHSDKRDRVLTADDMFQAQTSSDGQSSTYLSNVDSALASALNSVISDTVPVAAFDTGHSEKLDSTSYKKLLQSNSFETKDFNLLTDKIPDKTQLLFLGCPTTDYTDAEITKIESFLKNTSLNTDRSVLITYSAGMTDLPKLNSFLGEWGLKPEAASAVAETDANKYVQSPLTILANVQTTLSLGGAKTDYGYMLTPYSIPITIKSQSVGSKTTYSLIKSNDSSYLYNNSTKNTSSPQTGAHDVAALSQDTVKVGDKNCHANVIAMGSSTMFSNGFVNESAFGDGAYVVDLSKYATGTNTESTKITTTSRELYAKDITLSAQAAAILGYGVFTVLIPLAVLIAGIIVYRKRRLL